MERQQEALSRWLADHPEYELAEALVDAGVSAGKGKHRTRGALARFIEGGRSGAIPQGSCLVVESWSRFTREVATSSLRALLNDIWGQGLAISFCTDGVVLTADLIDREEHRLHGLLGAIGQARREWEERSRRSQGAVRHRERLQDDGQRPDARTPFWIARDPATGRLVREGDALVLDEHYAQALSRAVQLVLAGSGMKRTADQLNAEGFSPPPTRSRNQWVDLAPERKRGWSPGVVSYHLKSPALVGTLCRKAGDLPGYYPQVVDHATFARLRQVVESRDTLRATGRGNSFRARNLFQGLSRCAVCGGPISFTKAAAHARPNHPGFIGCAAASKKDCLNRGTVQADAWHDHCLTRLSKSLWEQYLPQPAGENEVARLAAEVEETRAERDLLSAHLVSLEERASVEWSAANLIRAETIERAVGRQKKEVEACEEKLSQVQQELDVARSRPRIADQAAEFRAKVLAFWQHLDEASGEERLSFNRWLLSREPQIRFLFRPLDADPGARPIELLVGGVSVGIEPLAPVARRMARALGAADPYAKDFSTSQGKAGVVAWQERLDPDELDSWPVSNEAPSTADG